MRMHMRRFTRLTNGFSKKADNHRHSVSLHYMFYNFCRIHQTLKVTPAMEAGLTDHVWSIEEICALLPKPTVSTSGEGSECESRPLGSVLRLRRSGRQSGSRSTIDPDRRSTERLLLPRSGPNVASAAHHRETDCLCRPRRHRLDAADTAYKDQKRSD